MKTLLLIITLTLSLTSLAQKLPTSAIQVIAGYGLHGSGDLDGVVYGAEYIKYYNKNFSLNYNFRAGIHNGKEVIITSGSGSSTNDASLRYTTAGVQVGANAGYSFVRTREHEMIISLGIFGRYQSASNGTDGFSVYSPSQTGIPTTLIGFDNKSNAQTGSIGAILQLHYNYTFNNKTYIGLNPGFQTDTNGDAIPQVTLSIGRRF